MRKRFIIVSIAFQSLFFLALILDGVFFPGMYSDMNRVSAFVPLVIALALIVDARSALVSVFLWALLLDIITFRPMGISVLFFGILLYIVYGTSRHILAWHFVGRWLSVFFLIIVSTMLFSGVSVFGECLSTRGIFACTQFALEQCIFVPRISWFILEILLFGIFFVAIRQLHTYRNFFQRRSYPCKYV